MYSHLNWNIGILAVIQAKCKIEEIQLFASKQSVEPKKIIDSIDYYCMIQNDKISILCYSDLIRDAD